ncbi:MAG: ABC transporter permease [Planctomycetota bacterium]
MRSLSAFPWSSLLPWLLLASAMGLVLALLGSPSSLLQLWRPWAEVGILGMGMTAIILTGGIDLSVGSMVALCGVAFGLLVEPIGWPMAAAGAVLVGFIAGALNASLIAMGIAPLVATLATMAFDAGLAMALSGGARPTGFSATFNQLGQGSLLGIPNQIWLLAFITISAWLLVHHTRFGRYLFAIGENRLAAEFAAVPVQKVEWWLYAVSGLLAGIVALARTAQNGAAVPDAGKGLELQVIACVVLGGTRVTGGAGGIGRTILGLAILAHLEIGLRLLGSKRLSVPWSEEPWRLNANGRLIVIGLLLIAVAVWNERLAARRAT